MLLRTASKMHVSSPQQMTCFDFESEKFQEFRTLKKAHSSSVHGSGEPLTEEAITQLLFDLDEKFIAEAYAFNLTDTMKRVNETAEPPNAPPGNFSPLAFDFAEELMLPGSGFSYTEAAKPTPKPLDGDFSIGNKRRRSSDEFGEDMLNQMAKKSQGSPRSLRKKHTTQEFKDAARKLLDNKAFIEEPKEEEQKAPRLQPCVKYVPEYITRELTSTSGEGRFTTQELLCCLLFAYTESLKANSYATIKMLMGDKRSRGSIRRKVEKVVKKETGIKGGLLGIDSANQELVLESLWKRFMKLAEETKRTGSPELVDFTTKLCQYANDHCRRK